MAAVADVSSRACRLLPFVAFSTQSPASISQEADVGQGFRAQFAAEALRMPAGIHGFDHATDDELVAFSTAGSVQDVKVVFAVLPALKFEVDAVRKGLETLRTYKAFGMPHLAGGVHDLVLQREAVVAPHADEVLETVRELPIDDVLRGLHSRAHHLTDSETSWGRQ